MQVAVVGEGCGPYGYGGGYWCSTPETSVTLENGIFNTSATETMGWLQSTGGGSLPGAIDPTNLRWICSDNSVALLVRRSLDPNETYYAP